MSLNESQMEILSTLESLSPAITFTPLTETFI